MSGGFAALDGLVARAMDGPGGAASKEEAEAAQNGPAEPSWSSMLVLVGKGGELGCWKPLSAAGQSPDPTPKWKMHMDKQECG